MKERHVDRAKRGGGGVYLFPPTFSVPIKIGRKLFWVSCGIFLSFLNGSKGGERAGRM